MKITTLIENRASVTEPGLASEWGLSLHIEFNDHSILFDTGASGAFADNAKHLSVQVDSIDLAILSHHHFDHGGGLKRFFELNSNARLYLGDTPDGECYIRMLGFLEKYIGLDPDMMKDHQDRFEFIDKTTEIIPDVFIFPRIVDNHPTPSGNKKLCLKKSGKAVARCIFS